MAAGTIGGDRGAALRDEVRRLRDRAPAASPATGIDLGPASAHEAVTRQMVEGVREDLREVRGRVNALLILVAGSALLDLVLGLVTGGR